MTKRRIYYKLPNGKPKSFLTKKNYKFAVASTSESASLACDYYEDLTKAQTRADYLSWVFHLRSLIPEKPFVVIPMSFNMEEVV